MQDIKNELGWIKDEKIMTKMNDTFVCVCPVCQHGFSHFICTGVVCSADISVCVLESIYVCG